MKSAFALVALLNGTPSTTKSGSDVPVMVLIPLMLIFVPLPLRPLVANTFKPGALPLSIRPRSASGLSSRSFLLTIETA